MDASVFEEVDLSTARVSRWLLSCLLAIAFAFLPALSQAPVPPGYTITTVAGTGVAGYDEEQELAASAQLNNPWGLALDGSGNLFIADQVNNRVRRVSADGKISTVAGGGAAAPAQDGDAATAAVINRPCGVAVDGAGNLYISATADQRIRKVTPAGAIYFVAGNGLAGFVDNDDALQGQLNRPIGIALDRAGNLYIADSHNHRIRKLGADGKLTTVAGNGTAGRAGNGGSALKAQLNYPQGVTVTDAGELYIADTFNGQIRKVDANGIITLVAGVGTNGYFGDGGPAIQAGLDYPKSVAVDGAGNVFVVDSFSGRIRLITSDGVIRTIAGNGTYGDGGDGGAATRAALKFPSGLALAPGGAIYVSDTQNSRVRLLRAVTAPAAAQGAPAISPGGVVSASAFGAFRDVARGSWIEIYGSNLAASARAWTFSDFSGTRAPTGMDGTRVTIGGEPAFLSYVSPAQVQALVPSNVEPGVREIRVTTAAGTSAAYPITVRATRPGLYAPPAFEIGGRQYAAALFTDGASFVLPAGAIPGVVSRRARPGDTLVLYGVGFGPVSPDVPAGEMAAAATSLASALEVRVGGVPAAVTYAGLAPGAIGVYQFNVVVPAVPAGDAVPLTFTLNGSAGAQTLYTAVGD